MYEKPLIHRGDILGARASPYAPAECSMLGDFGGDVTSCPRGSSCVA